MEVPETLAQTHGAAAKIWLDPEKVIAVRLVPRYLGIGSDATGEAYAILEEKKLSRAQQQELHSLLLDLRGYAEVRHANWVKTLAVYSELRIGLPSRRHSVRIDAFKNGQVASLFVDFRLKVWEFALDGKLYHVDRYSISNEEIGDGFTNEIEVFLSRVFPDDPMVQYAANHDTENEVGYALYYAELNPVRSAQLIAVLQMQEFQEYKPIIIKRLTLLTGKEPGEDYQAWKIWWLFSFPDEEFDFAKYESDKPQ